jgi:hypothetical protein
VFIVVGERNFAGIAEQLIDAIDRTPDDPLD